MISFKQYLSEKRRNPELNPKISAYDALKPYKDDPDIYISFTKIDKIGVNPSTVFNTPVGIYTYPLKEMWKNFNHHLEKVQVPFAGQSDFIWVLRQTGQKFQLTNKYNSADYDADMKKIIKLYDSGKIKIGVKSMADNGFKSNWAKIEQILPSLAYVAEVKKEPTEINIGSFDDHFTWDLEKIKVVFEQHKDNPTNSVLTNIAKDNPELQIDRTIKSVEDGGIGVLMLKIRVLKMEVEKMLNQRLKELGEAGLSDIEILIKNATSKSAKKNPFSAFWNVTRWIAAGGINPGDIDDGAGLAVPKDAKITMKAARKWNGILRALGYIGFGDKTGEGHIHPSEPTQAVFMDKTALKVVDKIININPKKVYKTIQDYRKSNYGIDELTYMSASKVLVYDNYMNNLQELPLVRIPMGTVKWNKNDITELARSYDNLVKHKTDPYMLDLLYENLWKVDDKTLTMFLTVLAQRENFGSISTDGRLVAAKIIIKRIGKNRRVTGKQTIKSLETWLEKNQ